MTTRKQGRRTAETAEQTKCDILRAAAQLFCDLGYERVSLRNISEQAGVSHSLIRHHFGSKEKIWHAISDGIDEFMQTYIKQLIEKIPTEESSAYRTYSFVAHLSAFTLLRPEPVKLLADAMRQKDYALLEYFLRSKDEFEATSIELFNAYNEEHPDNPVSMWEMKWQLIMFAHGASSMAPMMAETWSDVAENHDALLVKHWGLFNELCAVKFNIPKEKMIQTDDLNTIVLDLCCTMTESGHSCQEETEQS